MVVVSFFEKGVAVIDVLCCGSAIKFVASCRGVLLMFGGRPMTQVRDAAAMQAISWALWTRPLQRASKRKHATIFEGIEGIGGTHKLSKEQNQALSW